MTSSLVQSGLLLTLSSPVAGSARTRAHSGERRAASVQEEDKGMSYYCCFMDAGRPLLYLDEGTPARAAARRKEAGPAAQTGASGAELQG